MDVTANEPLKPPAPSETGATNLGSMPSVVDAPKPAPTAPDAPMNMGTTNPAATPEVTVVPSPTIPMPDSAPAAPIQTEAPTPASTPTSEVQNPTPMASEGYNLGQPAVSHLDEHPLDIANPVPTNPVPEQPKTSLTDINPNWTAPSTPEVRQGIEDAQAKGYTPSLEDTQPISMEGIRKAAQERGIDLQAPLSQTPTGEQAAVTPQQTVQSTETAAPTPTMPEPTLTQAASQPDMSVYSMGYADSGQFIPPVGPEQGAAPQNQAVNNQPEAVQGQAPQAAVQAPAPEVRPGGVRGFLNKLRGR